MIDRVELKKTWDLFVGQDGFTEVRILGKFQYSGYFKSFENLCAQLEPFTNMDDEQIYFVMNKIEPDCYARSQCEKFVKSPKSTTKDDEIYERQFLLCDFDPIRKSNISSSDEQFELARQKAQDVYEFLKGKGFSDQVIAISGSGWHLLIPVNIKCDEESDKIIKDFYIYMGSVFSDDKVEYDTKVFNRSRITKLYSVISKKGANIPSNPWRQSKIVYIPKEIIPTPIEKIKELADLAPKEDPKQAPNRGYQRSYGNQPFDLVTWLNQHGIVYKEERQGASTRFTLEYCPWVDTHSDRKKWDSALFLDVDGKITFNCHHSHCKDKTWFDFRTFYEPDAYAPKLQQYNQRYYQLPQAKQPVIKDETPELGKKWFGMKDIQKVNINDLPHFLTGFKELDKAIKGLFFSEVTILSGTNSSGKSSWLNSLMLNAIQQGVNTALWSGELRRDVLKTWIQMVAAGKETLGKSNHGDYWFVPNHIGEKIDNWLEGKFFLYNNSYSNKQSQIMNDMKELLSIGVRLFILDNLMSMNLDLSDGDSNKQQKGFISDLCDFAKKEQVHIILVAHPRKVSTFIRKTDISGSSDLTNAVDNVLLCHRVNNDFKKLGAEYLGRSYIDKFLTYSNVIEVAKNRMMGAQDVLCGMYYEVESRRFKNSLDEILYYGWRTDVESAGIQPDIFQENNEPVPF